MRGCRGRTLRTDKGQRVRRDQAVSLKERQVSDEARIETGSTELDAKGLNGRAGTKEGQRADQRARCGWIRAWLLRDQAREDGTGIDKRGGAGRGQRPEYPAT